MRARGRWTLLLSLALAGCGGAEPEPAPSETSAGAEEPPPPPPPPPARARVRALHVTSEPATATVALGFDEAEPAIRDLTYRASSAYVELEPGAHAVRVLGVPSVETGEAPTLLTTQTPELASGASATALVFGLAEGEPALTLVIAPDHAEPPSEGLAALRFFHALVGVGPVDVCAAGATPREPALPVFAAAAPGAFAAGDAGEWAEVLPSGELALQLRAPASEPCRGRVLGLARFTPSAGSRHTLVAIGRTTGRPRADRELLVCSDPPAESACTAVPVSAR